MLSEIRNAKEIKVHLESGLGYYVVGNKLIPFDLSSIENEIGLYIIMNGEEVLYKSDITFKTKGNIFEYSLYNNGSYEFAEQTSLYSLQYFTEEEFNKMCEKAQRAIRNSNNRRRETCITDVKMMLKELFPDIFLDISIGQGFNTYEWD